MFRENKFRFAVGLIALLLAIHSIILIYTKHIDFGTVFPLLFAIFLFSYAIFYHHIQRFFFYHFRLHSLWRLAWCGFWIWLISLLFFFYYLHQHAIKATPIQSTQAILVLGGGIQGMHPNPILTERLNAAAQLAQQNPQLPIIVSGGKAAKEEYSEAFVMANYLQQIQHIPNSRIHLEDQSTSTFLNFKYSKNTLNKLNLSENSPITIITSDFHTLRAQAIAKKQGYQRVSMYGAPTPLFLRYNTWLREYFAYVSGWLLDEY